MNRRLLLCGVLAGLAAAVLVLPSCSGDDSTTTSPGDIPGRSLVAPIMVSGVGPVTAKVGNSIDVVSDGVTRVSTDNPSVLQISQPHSDGSATFNAGAKVLSSGSAVLSVYGAGDAKLYDAQVTAEG